MTPQQWWWLAHQASTPMPTTPAGTPVDDAGRPIEGATLPSQTSPRAQGSPDQIFDSPDPDIEPTPIPFSTQPAPEVSNKWGDFTPRTDIPFSTPPSLPDIPFENVAPDDFSPPPQVDQYLYNPPTDEGSPPPETNNYFYDNLPVNDEAIPNNPPEFFGGGFNPVPAEAPWNAPDNYLAPPVTNPIPNEDIGPATPISESPQFTGDPSEAGLPTDSLNIPSDLSLSDNPDLSIGGHLPQEGYNYFPDGHGGYIAYDANWNPIEQMPGIDQLPSQSEPSNRTSSTTPAKPATPFSGPTTPPGYVGGPASEFVTPPQEGPNVVSNLGGIDKTGGSFFGGHAGPLAFSLPGATSQLGAFGGGNLGSMANAMFHGMWGGNNPYTEENYNNLLSFMNYQGNPFGSGSGKSMSYEDYVSLWNNLRSEGNTTTATQSGVATQTPAEGTPTGVGTGHVAVTSVQ